jgi:pyruvate formate lyase activating enzyme
MIGDIGVAELAEVEGIVFDIQRYSVHDGPGLRTSVFLKGCPLRCGWCANPESQARQPELALHAQECMSCGQFATTCPVSWQAAEDGTARVALLAERTALCPTGALHWIGRKMTAGAIMAEVRRDAPFYGARGGMTLTGGEPTMQPRLCEALLRLARAEGISTAMETSGYTTWPVFARLWPLLDTLLFDLKHVDPAMHQRHTGVDNGPIVENLRRLAAAGAPLTVRVPLIPDFNANAAAMNGLTDLLQSLDGATPPVDLLPYHALGRSKYAALGRNYPWRAWTRIEPAIVEEMAGILRDRGLRVRID